MSSPRQIKVAVVGPGYIAQIAMLPAFAHTADRAVLGALVTDDNDKATRLRRRYGEVPVYGYDEYEVCLASGIDAVYIALPNHLHAEYAIRAARAGIHVLCEKPMATTTEDCERMIEAARENDVKLMIAYRLHFEAGNLAAIELARSGKLGQLRLFSSVFCAPVLDPSNIRLRKRLGGGVVPDIGIYCINAARSIFRSEPIEVYASEARGELPRFSEVGMSVSAILRFPGDRLASFSCSFDGIESSSYSVHGDRGEIVVSPAFDFGGPVVLRLSHGDRPLTRRFPRRDQFAAELLHFANCIVDDTEPGPSGEEGLADVRIIEAVSESLRLGRPVQLPAYDVPQRPEIGQELHRPAGAEPHLIHAATPRGTH